MTRRFKLLGLAAVAVLAISAVSVASASAASFQTQSEPTFLKGLQESKNVFTTAAGTVKCSEAEFTSGQISSKSVTSVVVHPKYGGCSAFGQAASVSTTSCSYTLSIASGTGSTAAGSVTIACSTGSIVVNVPTGGNCSVTVGAQSFPSGSGKIDYESVGAGATQAVLVSSTVTGIVYGASGNICGSAGSAGTYSGSVLTKGYDQAAFSTQHGVFVG